VRAYGQRTCVLAAMFAICLNLFLFPLFMSWQTFSLISLKHKQASMLRTYIHKCEPVHNHCTSTYVRTPSIPRRYMAIMTASFTIQAPKPYLQLVLPLVLKAHTCVWTVQCVSTGSHKITLGPKKSSGTIIMPFMRVITLKAKWKAP